MINLIKILTQLCMHSTCTTAQLLLQCYLLAEATNQDVPF